MIHERAWSVHRRTGADYSELVSVGHSAFMRAVYRFSRNEGARFGTFLYRVLTNALVNAVKSSWYATTDMDDARLQVQSYADFHVRYQEWLAGLSASAVVLVNLLMNLDEEELLMDGELRPKLVRGALARRALEVGLTSAQCRDGMRELRKAVYQI